MDAARNSEEWIARWRRPGVEAEVESESHAGAAARRPAEVVVRVTPTQLFSAGAPGSCAGNGETVEEKMDDVRKDG
jgi:hypothetical protein